MKRLFDIFVFLGITLSVGAQSLQDYDAAWNRPTFSLSSFNYKYVFFGQTSPTDRTPGLNLTTIPPIPGLKYRSTYLLCPKDTCFASRAVIAVRCPDDTTLLRWASSQASCMVEWCRSGMYGPKSTTFPEGKSSADICNKTISRIRKAFQLQTCTGDRDMPNEQFGFILADCWQTEKYCTFFEATWYDMLSCGDTTRESYYSVDSETGEVAQLISFVPENKWPALAKIMMKYLRNSLGGLYSHPGFDWVPEDSLNLLKEMDGCALIREGLIIFYYPYHIGAGAEGEFKAVIPYNELDKVLL